MKKETEIAFEYGREAVKAGLDFIPSQDSNMYNLICESHIVSGHDRIMENMSAWYEGYLMQTAAKGQGISKELFS